MVLELHADRQRDRKASRHAGRDKKGRLPYSPGKKTTVSICE
jgi:hypothetical protein